MNILGKMEGARSWDRLDTKCAPHDETVMELRASTCYCKPSHIHVASVSVESLSPSKS